MKLGFYLPLWVREQSCYLCSIHPVSDNKSIRALAGLSVFFEESAQREKISKYCLGTNCPATFQWRIIEVPVLVCWITKDQFSFEATLSHVIFYMAADRKDLGWFDWDEGSDERKVKPSSVNTHRTRLEVQSIASKPVKRQCLSVTAFQCILF